MIDLTGKNVLVTGGSRGVGRATARYLAKAGANIVFTYNTDEKQAQNAHAILQEYEGTCQFLRLNLENEEDIKSLFSQARIIFPGGLDILVANAAIWPSTPFALEKMPVEHWRRTMRINLDGIFLITQLVLQFMNDEGRIVFVGSTAGQRGEAYHVDYAASKGALQAMVKSLCVELAPRKITVNCVAPGWIDTEMVEGVMQGAARERIESTIPLGRIASPDDVAGPILFLCSALANHITGEILNVNGGAVLCG